MALAALAEEVKGAVLPLLVVPPASDYDHEEQRVLTPGEHVRRFGPRLSERWGKRPVAVDGCMLDDGSHRHGAGDHPLTALIQRARNAGVFPIPVTGLRRTAEYQHAVRRIVEFDGLGVAVRLCLADLEEPDLDAQVQRLLEHVQCEATNAALYLDLASRSFDELDDLAELLIHRLNGLPRLLDWRMVFLAASEFPDGSTLSKLKTGTGSQYPRGEWLLYQKLLERSDELTRLPTFSDYGIEHPLFAPVKKGRVQPSVHLRYTTDRDYRVVKGPRNGGYSGIADACKAIVMSGAFWGDNFSAGDRFISRCALGLESHGGPSGWRCAGQNHHMMTVVRALFSKLGLRTLVGAAEEQGRRQADMFLTV